MPTSGQLSVTGEAQVMASVVISVYVYVHCRPAPLPASPLIDRAVDEVVRDVPRMLLQPEGSVVPSVWDGNMLVTSVCSAGNTCMGGRHMAAAGLCVETGRLAAADSQLAVGPRFATAHSVHAYMAYMHHLTKPTDCLFLHVSRWPLCPGTLRTCSSMRVARLGTPCVCLHKVSCETTVTSQSSQDVGWSKARSPLLQGRR